MRQIILILALICNFTFYAFGQSLDNLFNNPLRFPYDSAIKAFQNGDFHKAIALYTEVINKADSTSSFESNMRRKAFIYRSFCKKELKDFNGSIEDMNRAILIDPNDLASYIDRGTTYLEMGELQKAKDDFLKIIKTDTKTEQAAGAFYYLGLISCRESKIESGIDYFTKGLKIVPNDIEMLFSKGYYLGLTMDSKNAIKEYDKIIELDPSIKEVYANRGTEKINLYNRESQKDKKLLASACADLKKAKTMGDNSVDDLLFIHCN
jgi:tetratricopeptide (TPR) repeat protein